MKFAKWFFGGIGAIIVIYLFVKYADEISKVFSGIAAPMITGIVALQGREVKGVTS